MEVKGGKRVGGGGRETYLKLLPTSLKPYLFLAEFKAT